MGTFAETANFDYRLTFADQGKQTSVFRCRFRLVLLSVYIYIETTAYIFIYIYNNISIHRIRKPRRFSLIRLLVVHRVNGSFLFVRLFTKKQTEVIRLQMDQTNLPIYVYLWTPEISHDFTWSQFVSKIISTTQWNILYCIIPRPFRIPLTLGNPCRGRLARWGRGEGGL
jgi:hypothetical protein